VVPPLPQQHTSEESSGATAGLVVFCPLAVVSMACHHFYLASHIQTKICTELLQLSLAEEGEVCVGDGRNVIDGNQVIEASLASAVKLIRFLFGGHGNRRAKLAVGAGVTSL
jgi:hypothetical protein